MEFLSSSDSDDGFEEKEVEEELYSVLHYNDFSQGIPGELLDKYEISSDSKEFRISLKPKGILEPRPMDAESGQSPRANESDDSVIIKEVEREIVVLDDSEVEVTPKSLRDRTLEKVVEEYDENSDASCVEIGETRRKRKFSESSVICLTSDDEVDLSLNTTEGGGFGGYDSDGNVSDVVERSDVRWQDVASPSTWTDEMRKYYNSPCQTLRYFDHEKIRREIAGDGDWFVSRRDLYPDKRWKPRCNICRQTGHGSRDCPKQFPTCHMCGTDGHTNLDCPNGICLQCGEESYEYTSSCRGCSNLKHVECFHCKKSGHLSKTCPEKWREYHSTVDSALKTPKKRSKPARIVPCCNCGSAKHTFDQCEEQTMASFTKGLPAYSWLFGKGDGSEWRFSPNVTWPPAKRPRFSERPRNHGFTPMRSKGRPRDRPYKRRSNRSNESTNGLPWMYQQMPPRGKRPKKKQKKKKNRHSVEN